MKINVFYFASLRESLGRAEDTFSSDKASLSVAEVWTQTTTQPSLPDHILIAVNHEYTTPQAQVHDGDEVAFFPPVTGG